jgi:hypothetical protein
MPKEGLTMPFIPDTEPYCECEDDDCAGFLTVGEDPYNAEIYGDHTLVWVCTYHRNRRLMDVKEV